MVPVVEWVRSNLLNLLIALTILCGLQNSAWAFKLSPCLRVLTLEDGQLSQKRIRWWNLCENLNEQYTAAVHEHMTLGSIREYRGDSALQRNRKGWKYQYIGEGRWRKEQGDFFHQSHALMYGTWWNDDPLMLTWGQGSDFLGGVYGDRKFLKSGRPTYPGGTAHCAVPADQHLGRWSHFGALQHLHFMTEKTLRSTPEERVQSTTDRALTWIAFAYRVATRDLKPDDPLSSDLQEQAGLPSIAANECVDSKNVKIRTVFSRIGWTEAYRNEVTPDVALGSILHVLQDSWSPAHTCRVEQQGMGQAQIAVLKDVKNYGEQTSVKDGEKMHSTLDQYPQWLIDKVVHGQRMYENDPITAGAWVLAAVDQKLPWSKVEAYLRSTIFAPADPQKSASKPCIQVLARQ